VRSVTHPNATPDDTPARAHLSTCGKLVKKNSTTILCAIAVLQMTIYEAGSSAMSGPHQINHGTHVHANVWHVQKCVEFACPRTKTAAAAHLKTLLEDKVSEQRQG
jgi:hypothetical protein